MASADNNSPFASKTVWWVCPYCGHLRLIPGVVASPSCTRASSGVGILLVDAGYWAIKSMTVVLAAAMVSIRRDMDEGRFMACIAAAICVISIGWSNGRIGYGIAPLS